MAQRLPVVDWLFDGYGLGSFRHGMNTNPYNDDVALTEYIASYAKHFMTDLEKRCMHLCGTIYRIEGAQEDGFEGANDQSKEFWSRHFDDDVKLTLEMGYVAYRKQLHERFFLEAKDGKLPINRCPRCTRIARTPRAQYCRWCGFDWHPISEMIAS